MVGQPGGGFKHVQKDVIVVVSKCFKLASLTIFSFVPPVSVTTWNDLYLYPYKSQRALDSLVMIEGS